VGRPLINLSFASQIRFFPKAIKSQFLEVLHLYGEHFHTAVRTSGIKLFGAQFCLSDFHIVTSVLQDRVLSTLINVDLGGLTTFFPPSGMAEYPLECDLRPSATRFVVQGINCAPELDVGCFTASTAAYNLCGLEFFLATGCELPIELMSHVDGPLDLEFLMNVGNVTEKIARVWQSYLVLDPAKRSSIRGASQFSDLGNAFKSLIAATSAIKVDLESSILNHIDSIKLARSTSSLRAVDVHTLRGVPFASQETFYPKKYGLPFSFCFNRFGPHPITFVPLVRSWTRKRAISTTLPPSPCCRMELRKK
jgi:hypothetical protein